MLNKIILIAHAQDFRVLSARAGATSGSRLSLLDILVSLINLLLALSGVVILIFMLYGGFLWMTAGGQEDQVKKAKTIISNSVIGLIIVLSAFSIATFVQGALNPTAIEEDPE
jgi:D-alanyl-lipoteichoic acid acyltransferase DltB (MBOAT superfamily)